MAWSLVRSEVCVFGAIPKSAALVAWCTANSKLLRARVTERPTALIVLYIVECHSCNWHLLQAHFGSGTRNLFGSFHSGHGSAGGCRRLLFSVLAFWLVAIGYGDLLP